MIFTTKISEDGLNNTADLKYASCMFQKYISKRTELCFTVIGEYQYAVEIHSLESLKTAQDWRRYDDFKKTPYLKLDLPNDLTDIKFNEVNES